MPRSAALPIVLAAALAGSGLPAVALASEGFIPRPQREILEKPRIEDYSDYGTFLVDIMEYRRQKEERARLAAQAAAARVDEPESPFARDPYAINQPESLDEALERARFIRHPVYDERIRYDRTTSQSFPLEPLESPDLSAAELAGVLADPASGELAIYEDDGAESQAEGESEDAPEDSERAREAKASADSYAVTRAGVEEPGSKWVVDSDGNRYYLQYTWENLGLRYGGADVRIHYLYVDVDVEKGTHN